MVSTADADGMAEAIAVVLKIGAIVLVPLAEP